MTGGVLLKDLLLRALVAPKGDSKGSREHPQSSHEPVRSSDSKGSHGIQRLILRKCCFTIPWFFGG